jgi:hypothetical protein
MENLAQQLDAAMGGTLFVEGLDLKANMSRAEAYVSLHERLLNMIGTAQAMYAKSHGINFDDMNGFAALVAGTAMAAAQLEGGDKKEKPEELAISALVKMTMAKASRFKNLPLPEDAEASIIEATSTVVPKKPKLN